VVDDETVVLPLDQPFVNEGRFASLLVRDRELRQPGGELYELWRKAMKSLREIQVDPGMVQLLAGKLTNTLKRPSTVGRSTAMVAASA